MHFKTNRSHTSTENITITTQNAQTTDQQTSTNTPCSLTVNNDCCKAASQVLLSTAEVKVYGLNGNEHLVRALRDNGSQSNFVSDTLCHKLGLSKTKCDISISGISLVNSQVTYNTSLQINSTTNNFTKTLSCLILPVITGNIPSITFDHSLC